MKSMGYIDCRFINADNYELVAQLSVGELNMYSYCGNNPIMSVDPTGEFLVSLLIGMAIGFGVGAAIGGGVEVARQVNENGWDAENWDWKQIGLSALGGGVAGAISSISFGSGLMAYATSAITGGVGAVLGGYISGSVTDFESGFRAFTIGGFANILGTGITSSIDANVALNARVNALTKGVGSIANSNKFLLNYTGTFINRNLYSFISSGVSGLLSGWC